MSGVSAIPIVTLVVVTALMLAAAVHIAHRDRRALNFRTLGLVNFAVTNLISGVVHLSRLDNVSRGFYDVLLGDYEVLDLAVYGNVLGGLALTAACLRKPRPARPGRSAAGDSHTWITASERRLLILAIVVLTPFVWQASQIVRNFAVTSGDQRILVLDSGLARYSFGSAWIVWVIAFLAILIVRRSRSGALNLAILAVASVTVAWAFSWNGGRSIVLVMALPLVLVLLPHLRATRFAAVPIGVAAITYSIVAITRARSIGQTYDAQSLGSVLDWQWGRFSMLGFAGDQVEAQGLMYGETFAAGLINTLTGFVGFFGIGGGDTSLQSAIQVAREALLPTSQNDLNFIVPGFSAELFLNFGWLGLLIGYYFLGLLLRWADARFVAADGAVQQLLWAYVGSLLVFRTMNSDSSGFWQYVLFTGGPLLLVALLARALKRTPVAATPAPQTSPRPAGTQRVRERL